MATPPAGIMTVATGSLFLPWINRGLEGLWLLAVFLVPLIFLGQDYALSEAQIAYVEVPKVALLRGLAGLIAILWSIEWAIRSNALQGPFSTVTANYLFVKARPSSLVSTLKQWLKVHPSRWLLLAAGLFFGTTFVSTIFSGSFTTSIWGEIPGQDGYSAYTIASYGVLFAVITTHLKRQAQLRRLLGAIVLMGSLVGLYGALQHYGYDFLDVTESTGGGTARVTIFMGNTIFAGAVLAMTVPVTLMVATINFENETWGNWEPLARIKQLGRDTVATFFWALILSVQLLGLMFTFSRGPWSGAVLALIVFIGLVAVSMGWRMLVRTGLTLGLTGVFLVAFLHWRGNVSIVDVGPWFGFLVALFGLAFTFALLYLISRFGRAIPMIAFMGVVVVIVGATIILPSALSGRGNADSADASLNTPSTAGQVSERISSIKTEVLGGFVGGRGTHWRVSWNLIKDRPWFEFDNLSFSWLRPLIGYGPDLFRFTYLLESPPDNFGFLPLEPDHAHNFFIHQTVEQGFLGGIASVALFLSVFGVAIHQILRRRLTGNPVYRLLLLGLTAIIFGRFLEMMVGIARISDLTVLWVIFGLFAALVNFDNKSQETAPLAVDQPTKNESRRNRRRAARASAARSFSTGLIFRLAIVAWLLGGIGVVTWQKSINSVRAAVAEGKALEHFRQGALESTLKELDKAIKLAPGNPTYYNNRAQVFLVFQIQSDEITEQDCNQQNEVPYIVCLGIQSLESNLLSIEQQPFYYRSRIAAGNSAFNMQLHESAINLYASAANMVPNAWKVRVYLAESQIDAGFYDEALIQLEISLGVTGDAVESTQAILQKGRALRALGRLDEAESTVKHGLSLAYSSQYGPASLALLSDINAARGSSQDIGYFDRILNEDPEDAASFYFRGLAHLTLGNIENARADFEASASLGLGLPEVVANRGYTSLKLRDFGGAGRDLNTAVERAPQSPLFNLYLAEYQLSRERYDQAFNLLEIANDLDPNLGLTDLIRSKVFLALGDEQSARMALNSSTNLELATALDYRDRGELHASLGEYDFAFADLNQAIQINQRAEYYNARAKTYVNIGDFESAIADYDTANRIDPAIETTQSVYLKGKTLAAIGRLDDAIVTLKHGLSLAYASESAQASLDLIRDINAERGVSQDVGYFDQVITQDPNDVIAFYFRGLAHLSLGDMERAKSDLEDTITLGLTLPEVLERLCSLQTPRLPRC